MISTQTSTRCLSRLLAVALLFAAASLAQAQVTFAGTQVLVAGGSSFPLSSPASVAVDGQGNVYIADEGSGRILMVTSSGNQYGTPAVILSNLAGPSAVAADWTGNVFVADSGNNRIVMLAAGNGSSGAMTIASGLNNPSGVAVDASENVYVADTGNNRVIELPYAGGSYGSAIVLSAGFNGPTQVTVDVRKTLYVADTGNSHIIKIPLTATGYITKQILGVGTSGPMGVAVDAGLDMYVADTGDQQVIESTWNASGRFNKSTIVGGGFQSPQGMVADGSGGVYVSDPVANRVVDLVPSSVNFGTFAVGAPEVWQTYQFEVYAGTTVGNVGIFTQGLTGKDFTDAGNSTCAAGTYAVSTLCVVNVAFAPQASGQRSGSIILYDQSGNPLATAFISGVGAEPQIAFIPGVITYLGSGLSGPAGVAVDGSGNVFISDTGNDRVVEVAADGSTYGAQTTVLDHGISSPMGLAVDGADNLYIVSNDNDKVVRLPWLGGSYGTPTKVGTGLYGPTSVAVDGIGNVYITDTLDAKVWKVAWTGNSFAPEQQLGDYVHVPIGVAVDTTGDVFFTSPSLNNVAMLPMVNGGYQRQVNRTLPGMTYPAFIAVDGNSNVYVLDSTYNKVIMLPWNGTAYGTQITVATGFNAPSGLAVDALGNLYIADTGNNQIVKIDLSIPGPLNFGSVYQGSSSTKPLSTIVENIGNQPLNLTSVSYPTDFPQSGSSSTLCASGQSLGEGSFCSVSANFTPLSANPQFAEAVSLADNTLNSPATQSIGLSGAGTGELSQVITFPAIANCSYGAPAISLLGSASSGLPLTYQVSSGPAVIHGQTLTITGAGSIVVQATQSGSYAYQAAASATVSFTVSPALLTVTPNKTTAMYGSVPKSFATAITGFVFGQSAGQVLTGAPLVTTGGIAAPGVGTYQLTASAGSLSAANYAFAFVPGVLTVTPAPLVISAVSITNVYGKPTPSLAWTIAGLKNGDTASVVAGTPVLASTANAGSPMGAYPISVALGSLSNPNYSFQFVSGTLTVVPAVLTVTADNKNVTYGAQQPALTYTVSGYLQGDTQQTAFKGLPTLTTTAKSGSGAGVYSITAGAGTLSSNKYKFTFVAGSVTIQKSSLFVTPVSSAIVYGQSVPASTFSINGFANGDKPGVVSGNPTVSGCSATCVTAGIYNLQAGPGSLVAANYTFIYGTGTLTIQPALLTVTANPIAITYGQKLPANSYLITGFQFGDKAAIVGGAPVFKANLPAQSSVGTYVMTASAGSLTARNYNFKVIGSSITIRPAILTIVAENATTTYGTPASGLKYTLAGLAAGDTQATATAGQPALTTAVSAHTGIGSYAIMPTVGTLKAKNYLLKFTAGTLTIGRAPLLVTANDLTMKAGAKLPTLTCIATGLMNGEAMAAATSGAAAMTTGASSKSKAGSYVITITKGTMKPGNYLLSFKNGTLTVTP